MTIRKDIFQIRSGGESTDPNLQLLESINEYVAKLNLPDNWIVRKAWKSFRPSILSDGQLPFEANSWVAEFYINHYLYEQFYIHSTKDFHKIDEAKEKLQKKIDNDPALPKIAPELGKTEY
jgi:hypothetical protein